MATLAEITDASQPIGEFAKRVQGAMIKACWAVVYEGAVTDHDVRLGFAKKVLQDPRTYMERYYRVFLCDGTVQAGLADLSGITDTAIENAVNGFWTIIANLEG